MNLSAGVKAVTQKGFVGPFSFSKTKGSTAVKVWRGSRAGVKEHMFQERVAP